jgi:hypothetical protein
MPGPMPNPDARRRNAGSSFKTLPSHGRQGPVPPLPRQSKMLQVTRDAWEAWWKSPMATQWTDSDVPEVALAAGCFDAAMRGDLDSAKEFRMWADRFGLSPKARLANRWTVEVSAAAGADAAAGEVVKLTAVPS